MSNTILVSPNDKIVKSLHSLKCTHLTSLEAIPETLQINSVNFLVIYDQESTDYKTLAKVRMLKALNPLLKVIYVLTNNSPSLKTLFELGIDLPIREEVGFEKIHDILQDLLGLKAFTSTSKILPKLEFKGLTLDPNTRLVTRGIKKIHLRKKEFDLLEFLMFNQGRVVSKPQILEQVWDYHFDAESKTVDVHISSLRSKIDKGHKQKYIQTVYGSGYTLDLS